MESFIELVNESDLDKHFPRKNLKTIRRQCEELVQV
jgi:hypothetical protein